ncbi:hypothetical protein Nstercoris_00683 [Nitrosomonas stercoris]|uniref:Toxin RelG n=1 Tax=Nitrosomonas stercoris TaxID=1444684 RepID=A0A4Y1YNQ4_9PROT|nr:hypothetical protein Nstercoris_00683 [Nitrosomonas stercoris]
MIDYADSAVSQLCKLDRQTAKRIINFMEERVSMVDDPRSTGKALTGPFNSFWRYRVGDYRIVCDIQDGVLHVLVLRVGHRKEVYR